MVASKPLVGSSSSRIFGLCTHSIAMTSLRFSPPDMPPWPTTPTGEFAARSRSNSSIALSTMAVIAAAREDVLSSSRGASRRRVAYASVSRVVSVVINTSSCVTYPRSCNNERVF